MRRAQAQARSRRTGSHFPHCRGVHIVGLAGPTQRANVDEARISYLGDTSDADKSRFFGIFGQWTFIAHSPVQS
jgi:hypothetical protein